MAVMVKFICAAFLATSALATRSRFPQKEVSLATIPMHMYASDCGKHRPVSLAQVSKVPGAGLGKVTPFQTVLKDGFFNVACVKDMMFDFGDKFGDQKFSYKLGDVSNVSIVHYNVVVAKEDRKEMTHETCFEFCRTVPDMLFFGLTHGRDCYCAPYYKQGAGDSSDCDEVCASNPTQMCGGKTKSIIFEMHECSDTKANLDSAAGKATDMASTLSESVQGLDAITKAMQDGAQKNQDTFGQAGDPAAADLFQSAKVFAGELQHAVEEKQQIHDDLTAAAAKSAKLSGADLKDYKNNEQAQSLTAEIEKHVADAEDAVEGLDALSKLASPVDKDLKGTPSDQYYSLMYFVDKKFVKDPSTCTGKVDQRPMVGVSANECANACDKEVLSCVGFSHYAEDGFCFLFSEFTEVTYYTGCSAPSLLQFNIGESSEKTGTPKNCEADWEGSWTEDGDTGNMKLRLTLADKSKLSGSGSDSVGNFTVDGIATTDAINFKKTYATYALEYGGASTDGGESYDGTYTIDVNGVTGGFKFHAPKYCAGVHPTCYAKLSEFEGTDLTPDASGKCQHGHASCLKKATKAARCYK